MKPRRRIIVGKLAEVGLADADQRVIIEKPEGEGLYGLEAARYGSMRQMGVTGGGMGGGMGGGGMGGGMGGGGMGGGMMGGGMGGGMMGGGGGIF